MILRKKEKKMKKRKLTPNETELYLDSIPAKNHLPSLYSGTETEKNQYNEFRELKKKIKILPYFYRKVIYEEKRLKLFCKSKRNEISQIDWINCCEYFLLCLSEINPNLYKSFTHLYKWEYISTTHIISCYGRLNKTSKKSKNKKTGLERGIACVKWYNIIQQLNKSLSEIKKCLDHMFFDLWFIQVVKGKILDFVFVKNNFTTYKISGILTTSKTEYIETPDIKQFFGQTHIQSDSQLSFIINNRDVVPFRCREPWCNSTNDSYSFGLYYPFPSKTTPDLGFYLLNINFIPNTQDVLTFFFKNDLFFQDLITEGVDKELYNVLNQFPISLCELITQYLKSIFYTFQNN